jgi:NitT/TauT family transport system ATP-binding protein
MYDSNIPFINDVNIPDVIELKNICQSYDGGKTFIIKDLNLLIEDNTSNGKFVVVLGTSGCGKSTLLRFITGIQKPTSGQVLINGKAREDKTVIGMVFQQYSSFPWLSVLDNVALGLKFKGVPEKERHARAMEMIKLVGLEGQESKYAKYPNLSGGQLQRVAIARSLISTPEVLLLDEPFSALDVNTRLKMQDLLCDLWGKLKTTVIFVTHDLTEAVYLGNEIFIMRSNPGQIVKKINIELPYKRSRAMKREKQFTDIVYGIDDELRSIEKAMDEEKRCKCEN